MSWRRWPWLIERVMVPLLGTAVALAIAVVTYSSTERSKLREQGYELERVRYEGLLMSLNGLLVGSQDQAVASEFLQEARLCALYCPDEVVRALNAFTDANPTGAMCGGRTCTSEDRGQLYAALVVTIRRHLFATYRDGADTTLGATDMRVLRANEVRSGP